MSSPSLLNGLDRLTNVEFAVDRIDYHVNFQDVVRQGCGTATTSFKRATRTRAREPSSPPTSQFSPSSSPCSHTPPSRTDSPACTPLARARLGDRSLPLRGAGARRRRAIASWRANATRVGSREWSDSTAGEIGISWWVIVAQLGSLSSAKLRYRNRNCLWHKLSDYQVCGTATGNWHHGSA